MLSTDNETEKKERQGEREKKRDCFGEIKKKGKKTVYRCIRKKWF